MKMMNRPLTLAILAACVLTARTTAAADRYWVAPSSGNWNDTANWSASSGGAGGSTVPGSSDVAIFNGSSVANCLLNVNVNVAGVSIVAGYTGTVTQGAGFTVTVGATNYSQAAGAFLGGDASIRINGTFSLSGGAFTSTSGTISFANNVTIAAGGTFNHNSGTFMMSTDSTTARVIDVNESLTLNDLWYGGGHGNWIAHQRYDIAAGDTLIVLGDFTRQRTQGASGIHMYGGTIEVHGDLLLGPGSMSGNTTVRILGSGDQSMTGAGTDTARDAQFTSIVIDKPSGILSLSGTLLSTFNSNVWTYVRGDLDPGDSIVEFRVGNGQTRTISGDHALYDVRFSDDGGYNSITVASGSTLTALGSVTAAAGTASLNGSIEVAGDYTKQTSAGGNAAISLIGGGEQAISVTTATSGAFRVAKTGGRAVLASSLSLNASGQDLHIESGTLDLAGFSLTVNDQFAIGSEGTLRFHGDEVLSKNPTSISGTVAYSGDGAYDIRPWSYHSLSLEGAGTYSLTAPLAITGDWTKADTAVFVHSGHGVTLTGSNQTIMGSTSFADLTKVVTIDDTLTFEAGSRQTITGTLTLRGNDEDTKYVIAEADSVVRAGTYADNNHGSETELMVKNDPNPDYYRDAFLRFDVSSCAGLTAASLRLHPGGFGSEAVTHECRPVLGAWEEMTVTYNTAPAVDDAIASWLPALDVPTSIDVSVLAQAAVIGSGKVDVCLRSVTESSSAWARYWSREAPVEAHRPQLVLTGDFPATVLSLRSTEPGTRWEIDPQGTRDIEFVDVQDSNNVNALAIDAVGRSVVNSGRNVNWHFETDYIEVVTRAGTVAAGAGAVVEVELWSGDGTLISDSATQITFTPVGATAAEIVGSGGVGQPVTVTASNGTASIAIEGDLAESFVIEITNDGGYDNPPDEPVTIVPASPYEVRVNDAPEDFPAGGGTSIEVYIYDQYGNHCISDDSTEVTFTPSAGLSMDGGDAGDAATVTVEGGAASAAISSIVSGPHTVTISSLLVDPSPVSLSVYHGTGAELVTTIHPEDFVAGNSTSMTVELHDAYGNVVLDEPIALTFSFAGTDDAEFAGGDGPAEPLEVTMALGEATVTISNTKTETFQIYVANDASMSGPSPNPESVTVTHAASSIVVVTQEPASFQFGTSTTMRMEVRDAYGNLCTGDSVTEVVFTPSAGSDAALSSLTGAVVAGDGSPGAALTVSADSGVVGITIADAEIEEFTISWTCTVGAPGERTLWSYAGDPVEVSISVEPADFIAGESTALTVELLNDDGVLCQHDNDTTVTFTPSSLGSIDGGPLGGPVTVSVTAGVATVEITSQYAHVLTVWITSGLATNPSQRTINVIHAASYEVTVTREPSNFAAYGETSMRVSVRDEFGNQCSNDSSTEITFTPTADSGARLSVGSHGALVSGGGVPGEAIVIRASAGLAELSVTSDVKGTFTISTSSALQDPADRTISVASFAGLGEGEGCAPGPAGGGAPASAIASLLIAIAAFRRGR